MKFFGKFLTMRDYLFPKHENFATSAGNRRIVQYLLQDQSTPNEKCYGLPIPYKFHNIAHFLEAEASTKNILNQHYIQTCKHTDNSDNHIHFVEFPSAKVSARMMKRLKLLWRME